MKICKVCSTEKPLDEFYKNSTCQGGLEGRCKKCHAAYTKSYYEKNKESRKQYRDNYYHKRHKELRSQQSEWQKRNRDKINRRSRERAKEDPIYALSLVCRTRIKCAFQSFGYKKNTKTRSMIGCDWDQLKSHIENQFDAGMSWANRGEWEIDHIVPIASAKSEDRLLELFHYTNLQPLWKADNRAKGTRIAKAA